MGLFQSVFSVSEEVGDDLDPFQCQEGTYKKLDIDAVAASVKTRNDEDPPLKKSHKLYLTAPRQRSHNKSDRSKTRNGKKTVGLKSRHSEKIGRDRPKPIVLGPDASISGEGSTVAIAEFAICMFF